MMKTPQPDLQDDLSDVAEHTDVRAGSPLPLGTQETEGGVNFAVFSRYASRVRLEFFDHPEDAEPARIIDLDSVHNRTGDVWHVWVEGIGSGQLYACWMVEMHVDGFRFDLASVLGRDGSGKLLANAWAEAADFSLPSVPPGARWHLAADTSRKAPQDLSAAGDEPICEDPRNYHLGPRSSAILLAR